MWAYQVLIISPDLSFQLYLPTAPSLSILPSFLHYLHAQQWLMTSRPPNSLLVSMVLLHAFCYPMCQVFSPSLTTKFSKNSPGKLVTPSLGLCAEQWSWENYFVWDCPQNCFLSMLLSPQGTEQSSSPLTLNSSSQRGSQHMPVLNKVKKRRSREEFQLSPALT